MSNMQLEIWGQSLEHTKILISESLRQKDIKLTETCFFFSHEEQVKCKDWRLLSLQGADFRGKMEEKAVEGNCKKEVREIVKEQESRHP